MSLLDQFRGSTGVRGAFNKDSEPGDTVAGKITATDVMQVREYKKDGSIGELLFFDDGKPKQQIAITVDTGEKSGDDDGLRRVYVRMDYKSQREALFAAIAAADDDDLRIGGHFAARYEGKPDGWNVYTYEYRKPSATAGLLGGAPGVPPGQTATVTTKQGTHTVPSPGSSQPSVPAVTSTPAAAVDPAQVAAVRGMIAANVPDAAITAAFPAISPELLAALRNAG